MDRMDFTAMSTTAMILITVTLDRCRSADRSALITSTETRRAMGGATWATLAMTGRVNMRFPDIGVVGMQVDMAAGTARARCGLNEGRDKARVASYLAWAPAK
jgi:hypothetical protein